MGLFSSIASIAAPVIGGLIGGKNQKDSNAQNAAYQKEFAQHGIRWKVEDAKAAGLHPLAALGSSTATFSPSFKSDNMGQDISRAINAVGTAADRWTQKKADNLALEKASLENDLLRAQITNVNQASNPPFPSGGTTGDILVQPSQMGSTRHRDIVTEAAPPAASVKEFIAKDGSVLRFPSEIAKQSMEDMLIPEFEWYYHNRVKPWMVDNIGMPIYDALAPIRRAKRRAKRRGYYGRN